MSTKQAGVVSCKQVVVMSTLSAVPGSSHDARAHEAAKRATQTPRRTRLRVISNKEERCGKDSESFTQRKKNDAKEKKWKVWMHRREPGCMREERESSVVRRRVWRLQTGCLAPSVLCSVSVVTCTCTRICAKKERQRLTDAGHLPDPRKRSWRYRHLSPAGQQSPRAQYRQHTSWCVTPSLPCACACGCG